MMHWENIFDKKTPQSSREIQWLSSLSKAVQPISDKPAPKKSLEEFLVYVLQLNPSTWMSPVSVEFQTVRRLKTGCWGAPRHAVQDFTRLIGKEYVSEMDRLLLLNLLRLGHQNMQASTDDLICPALLHNCSIFAVLRQAERSARNTRYAL